MNQTKQNLGILPQAIDAVGEMAGLEMQVTAMDNQVGEHDFDAFVQLVHNKQVFTVEIRKWLAQANLGALIYRMKMLPRPALLVADYVNPRLADKLRKQDVQFIDTCGNAYINQTPVYIYVTGNRPVKNHQKFLPTKGGTNRAFEPKGLIVVFAFLCRPILVNAPYREIAEQTGVALGTIGWVINGLKAGGYIQEYDDTGERRLVNYRKLLDRWVETYPEKLRPRQTLGVFLADAPDWWKDIDIKKYAACWGGEVAAAAYTDYLVPAETTIYTHKTLPADLLATARLRKASEWTNNKHLVHIYQAFWPETFNNTEMTELAHPILVYADLLATGDPRNIEVAKIIYEKNIAQYCRED